MKEETATSSINIMDRRAPRTILIVDDELLFCEMMCRFLEGKGYRALVALDGYEALAVYEQERPDVVLLDMNMPGKDGLETLRDLKASDPEAAVFMVTAAAEGHLSTQARAEGALEYITKPISLDYLEAALQATIGLRGDAE